MKPMMFIDFLINKLIFVYSVFNFSRLFLLQEMVSFDEQMPNTNQSFIRFMEAATKLVHHTALAFTVEKDNQQIQALRKIYDPAFQRWQPHINICFPFVDQSNFQQTFNTLQQRFNEFPAFDIVFRKMDFFPHGTVFLFPQTKGNQLLDIEKIITTSIPQLKANREFHPHMTVGKFGKGEVAAKKAMLEKHWKEWVVRCDGIHIIERGKDTPFKTWRKIQFMK